MRAAAANGTCLRLYRVEGEEKAAKRMILSVHLRRPYVRPPICSAARPYVHPAIIQTILESVRQSPARCRLQAAGRTRELGDLLHYDCSQM